MGALALEIQTNPHMEEMISYLSSEDKYWIGNDKWKDDSEAFKSLNLGQLRKNRHIIADFSFYRNESIKVEAKYAILLMMKEKIISAFDLNNVYSAAIKLIGNTYGSDLSISTLAFAETEDSAELNTIIPAVKPLLKDKYVYLKQRIIKIITELYDSREETEKDIWYARKIPGVKQSATAKRCKTKLSFVEIPENYRDTIS